MNKPEEITQDAWDAGMKEARFYADWLHAGNSSGSVSPHAVTALADTIARAIMAAEEEEREACAQAVEGGDSWSSRSDLAAAIRQRGAPHATPL